jgi:hypothetical protein
MSISKKHIVAAIVLVALCTSLAPVLAQVERGPYLQQTSETSVRIKWRTDSAIDSVVRYGPAAQNLSETVDLGDNGRNHDVLVDGLQPDTRYYYSVKSSASDWAGGDTYHFETAPPVGSPQANQQTTRIWVLGDSGTANSNARAVRDAYLGWANNEAPDIWLMLGDNAYNDGTDAQYQAAVFDMYPTMLRRVALWSTLGNHDGYSADSASLQGPYYDIFSLPENGEVGGLASGTEAYYSFDHANIHFVCLDSYDTDTSSNGAMANWLRDDLSATTQPWIIAFWHHPPYTKGSHDSDTEGRLQKMRENFLPILDNHSVDLVLTGHSHSYERSFLIDGHYGNSGSFSSQHLLDGGDGQTDGDGAYSKQPGPHGGAVYAVAGSSGKVSGGSLDHPAMFVSLQELGSMNLDVQGNRLEGIFLNDNGVASDHFTIEKGPDMVPPEVVDVTTPSQTEVKITFNEPVDEPSATTLSNWDINGDIDVLAAAVDSAQTAVTLSTAEYERNVLYELTISGVADLDQNALPSPVIREFALADLATMSFRDGQMPTQNYAGTVDTKIKSDDPTANFGSAEQLEVDGSPSYGVLLRWDVSGLPDAVTVLGAELTLEVTDNSNDVYDIFGLLRDWREQEATWDDFQAGQSWQNSGAQGGNDRDDAVLGSLREPVEGSKTVALAPDASSLIEQWIDDPSTNQGFLVAGYNSTSNGVDFLSRETGSADQRPMLTVEYRPDLRRADDDTEDPGDTGDTGDDIGTPSDTDDTSPSDIGDSSSDVSEQGDLNTVDSAASNTLTPSGGRCACDSVGGDAELPGSPAAIAGIFGLLVAARCRRSLSPQSVASQRDASFDRRCRLE